MTAGENPVGARPIAGAAVGLGKPAIVEGPTARMALATLALRSGVKVAPERHVLPGAPVVGFNVRRGHE